MEFGSKSSQERPRTSLDGNSTSKDCPSTSQGRNEDMDRIE